ncbi:unnamed protein product [Vitrella brassicaformis CCMP3155]|uniref:Potassium channel tetramerisation-type BTB domain-containing protein n=2 Tax=Vitrella brassicaformis TaxID=1169539 RepID=A0A0G4GKV4_VITBC|nr:unnamed protein product [Vitrella brassicaformis CCMP3155]|eukprot:CEM30658.1 unnamed protein product [Vitrella brassicaformis CCMP3155]
MHVHAASLVRDLDRIPSGLQTRVSLNTITNQPTSAERQATNEISMGAFVCCFRHDGSRSEGQRGCRHTGTDRPTNSRDSLTTEFAILSRFHVPVVHLCESLKPLEQEITAMQDSITQLKQSHGIADPPAARGDDMLMMNVGGSEWHVSRKHLTEGDGVEGSLLATLFSGKFDNRLMKDDKQRVFVDMDTGAFAAIHQAILAARAVQQATREGGRDGYSAGRLLADAHRRAFRGADDFWVRKLLSPVKKTPARDDTITCTWSVSTARVPKEARELAMALDEVLKAHDDKRRELERQLSAEKPRHAQLTVEIQGVEPFLAPLSGVDPIRVFLVCGQTIATTQSTIDEMSDDMALKRRNTASLWGSSVDDVAPDHVRRLIDHHRRKRHGASVAEASLPLQLANTRAQRAFDFDADMYGVKVDPPPAAPTGPRCLFVRLPSGASHKVIRTGLGAVPAAYQRVSYRWTEWRDGFGSGNKIDDGWYTDSVSSPHYGEWYREALQSMRVGETRRVIVPRGMYFTDQTAYVEIKMEDILG